MTRIKGQLTTAEPLDFEDFKRLLSGLRQDKLYNWELYCMVSFATACRVSDIRKTTWEDVLERNELVKLEQKTEKTRRIPFSDDIQTRLLELYRLMGDPDKSLPLIANPRLAKAYSREHINRMLKRFRFRYKLPVRNFSTHTFRKTFGRYVWDSMGRSMEALTLLCLIFKHASIQTTMIYLGIRQDEINSVFHGIKLG